MMLIGVNVTDTFLIVNHHKIINMSNTGMWKQKITVRRFAGILAHQLITQARRFGTTLTRFCPDSPPDIIPFIDKDTSKSGISDLSSDFAAQSDKAVRSLKDANGTTHYLVKYDIT